MIFPMEYTHLGYDFLDRVNYRIIHSGTDFNFGRPEEDLGRPILAITAGEVIFIRDTGKGWGRMIVLYHPSYGVWSRYAHLDTFSVSHGEKVEEGQQIGTCGNSGGNWSSHLHLDIIRKELAYWTSYTSFMTKDEVKKYYQDPIRFIEEIQKTEKKRPIIEWNIKNKVIEHWKEFPSEDDIRLGWLAYKLLKIIKTDKLKDIKFKL